MLFCVEGKVVDKVQVEGSTSAGSICSHRSRVLWLVVGASKNSPQKSKLNKRNSRDAIKPEIKPPEVAAIESERGNLVRPNEPQINDVAKYKLSNEKFTRRSMV